MRSLIFSLMLAFLSLSLAQASTADDATQAVSLYRSDGADASERLFGRLREDPERWGPALALALEAPDRPERFYFDAARALASFGVSKAQLDKAAAVLALRANFKTLDRSQWLFVCQKIGSRGGDARPCARRLLDEESFSIALFGGDDALGKDYALAFVLLSMEETLWNREMGDRLWIGRDWPSSQVALLNAMFYAVSLRDDVIIARFSEDTQRSPEPRARAEHLLSQMKAMESASDPQKVAKVRQGMGVSDQASEEDLRLKRRQAMSQVSRSALQDLERYTYLIRAAALPRWKREAKLREPPG